MLRPYYKIAPETDRLLPERIPRKQFTRAPVLYPIVKAKPKPVERRHPPALPLIKKAQNVFIKQAPVKITASDRARRLRLAKAKAKARLRKIKLLAI